MSEAVNISGDFNGNLYVNSQPEEPKQVGENYVADVTWMGSIYRLEMVSKNGTERQRYVFLCIWGRYVTVRLLKMQWLCLHLLI